MKKAIVRCYCIGMVLVLGACGAGKKEIMQSVKDNDLLQEKTINDHTFRLQYMPPQPADIDDTVLAYFRLNVKNITGVPMKETEGLNYSYGLDTLFMLVHAGDTIPPVDVNRIANGTMNGVEYMLVFNRQSLYATDSCKLFFKDWLFTNQLIAFPLKKSAIAHIDSLSLKI